MKNEFNFKIQNKNDYFKKSVRALTGVAQGWALARKLKGRWFDSGWGHMPGL